MKKGYIAGAALLFLFSCGTNTVPQNVTQEDSVKISVEVDPADGVQIVVDSSVFEKNVDTTTQTKPTTKSEKPASITKSKPEKPVLNGDWILEKVYNAKEPFKHLFPNGAPTISFDEKESSVSGKNGCNSYGGPYSFPKSGGIKFGDMFSTRMHCEGVQEHLFMTSLNLADDYSFDEKGNLILKNNTEPLLLFKRK